MFIGFDGSVFEFTCSFIDDATVRTEPINLLDENNGFVSYREGDPYDYGNLIDGYWHTSTTNNLDYI